MSSYMRFRAIQAATACAVSAAPAVHGQHVRHLRLRAERAQVALCVAFSAAAVRDEGRDPPAGKVVFLQQRRDRRSDSAPPVGRAQIDHAVCGQVVLQFCNRRPVACADLPLRLLHQRAVFGGIGRRRPDLLYIRAGLRPYDLRHRPGVGRDGKVEYNAFVSHIGPSLHFIVPRRSRAGSGRAYLYYIPAGHKCLILILNCLPFLFTMDNQRRPASAERLPNTHSGTGAMRGYTPPCALPVRARPLSSFPVRRGKSRISLCSALQSPSRSRPCSSRLFR